MRPEVAQKRKADPAQTLRPRFQTGDMINADTQNLGVQSRELGLLSFVRRDLTRSYGGPCQREERQHDVAATKIAQGNSLILMAGQGKIRCFVTGS